MEGDKDAMIVCPEIKWVDGKNQQREGYYLDALAMKVAEAIVSRVKERKQDVLLIINGREGAGKTNAAVCVAHYISSISGRTFNNDNIFFDLKKMMTFSGSTKEQIILWDEGAIGGLANDWTNLTQKKLNAFLMICRKLRHIFIFNIPRFYRLSPNIIERAHVMFHMFEDAEETPGNFILIGQEGIENLYNEWRSTRRANYFRYKKAPPGHFTWVLPALIDEDRYEQEKSDAIAQLASVDLKPEPKNKTRDEILLECYQNNQKLKKPLTQVEFGKVFGLSDTKVRELHRQKEESERIAKELILNPLRGADEIEEGEEEE